MTETTYRVSGMTCEHCVRAVKEELGALAAVASVEVDLAPDAVSTVRVSSSGPLDPTAVAAAIDEAGYALAT
jgi:copper chaperone CopZ